MVRYLLDSNILIEHLSGRFDLARKVSEVGETNCFLSAIVRYELVHGALKSARTSEYAKVSELLSEFPQLPFDSPSADKTAEIRHYLQTRGQLIGSYDLLLAGAALAHDLVLVTHNTSEFGRVQGLRIEDWQVH